MLLGHGGAENAEFRELGPQVRVEARAVGPFELAQALVGGSVAEHLTGQVADRLLLLAEGEVHVVSSSRPVPDAQLRIARGRPMPNMPIRSRWISLVPPPKVRISRLR